MTGKNLIMAVLLLLAVQLNAQVAKDIPTDNKVTGFKQKGYLTMGIRNTISTFNGGGNYSGYGVGGHFRVPIIPRINTEWYADYITNNIGNMGHRTDYHIGWSVMYYLINPSVAQHASGDPIVRLRKFNPFVEAGHCFDYGGIYSNGDLKPSVERWSSAVQAGVGTHYNITPRFDLTLKAQYMMHLGKEVHGEIRDGQLEIEEHSHGGLEGHLLVTFSINCKLIKLWEK